jgi:hypothetical protein
MHAKPDIIAKIYFYKTEEGGRKGPVSVELFHCPSEINGEKFDCGLEIGKNRTVAPGDTITVPVYFLSPKIVRPMLTARSQFKLWDGRFIADCVVEEIIPE